MTKWVGLILMVLAAGSAAAEEAEQPEVKWESDAELGLIVTNGNSKTQNISTKINLLNERPMWRHSAKAEGLKTSDAERTTAEKYLISGKTNYKFTKHDYTYLLLNYEDDRFSGYEYQASELVGYGHRFLPAETVKVDLELGVGARQSRIDETGEDNEEGVVQLAGMLEWKISKTAVFKEEISSDIGEDNTISKSVTSLKAKVSEDLAMKLSFTAKRNSEVPPGVYHTDTETAVTLVYSLL